MLRLFYKSSDYYIIFENKITSKSYFATPKTKVKHFFTPGIIANVKGKEKDSIKTTFFLSKNHF
jgi:hypothetical protein